MVDATIYQRLKELNDINDEFKRKLDEATNDYLHSIHVEERTVEFYGDSPWRIDTDYPDEDEFLVMARYGEYKQSVICQLSNGFISIAGSNDAQEIPGEYVLAWMPIPQFNKEIRV